jgi:hypothetical protein
MMLLSFNSNTMVDTSGAGTDYYFVSPAFIHSFYCHQRCPISSFLCSVLLINVCLFVRFLLVIVLSDYLFGIFKHFLQILSYWPLSFRYCVVCSSSIYGFWLHLWYLQALLADQSWFIISLFVILVIFEIEIYIWYLYYKRQIPAR